MASGRLKARPVAVTNGALRIGMTALPRIPSWAKRVLDLAGQTRSRMLFSDGFFISRSEIEWFTEAFLGGTDFAPDDPEVSPLRADLTGLAPALVFTGGFDPLRDEGNEYAAALRRTGVTVHHRQFDTLPHGFASIAPLGGDSADALASAISAIRTHFGHSGAT